MKTNSAEKKSRLETHNVLSHVSGGKIDTSVAGSGIPEVSTSSATSENPIPPLRQQLGWLLHPLTTAGQADLPLWYLVRGPLNIGPAPAGAPLPEKMRRVATRAAIGLFWPIARLVSLYQLWRNPPRLQSVLALWQAIEADQRGHKWGMLVIPGSASSPTPNGSPSVASQSGDSSVDSKSNAGGKQ